MPYAVIAHYQCRPEDVELVRDALLKMREHTLQEPANLFYIVHSDPEDPTSFTLYEQYTDQSGFEAHAQTPHFTEHIVEKVRPRLLNRTVTFLDVL